MRAALLPTPGDPFLIAYWLRNFATWRTEVDELRILVNGQRLPEILAFIEDQCRDAGAIVHIEEPRFDHGEAIAYLLERTSADHILLCEDDAFVRQPGVIAKAFSHIESGQTDIVASPRSSVSDEIRDAAQSRFGHTPGVPSQESGASFWPSFFFGRKSDLLATDGDFSAHGWPAGVYVPELNFTPERENAGDTFVHATYQLRDKGLRVQWESQWRADREQMERWLGMSPPWFHVGSLSAGYGYVFFPEAAGRPDSFGRIAATAREAQSDWEKRMSWWERITRAEHLPEHRAKYRAELERFIDVAGLDRHEIARWTTLFDPWVTW